MASNDFADSLILVVDDSAIARRRILEVLEQGGFRNVRAADCATAALETVETATPDLFLLDLMMPDMDGIELCGRLKRMERFADTPVLFITGSKDMAPHWESFEVGAVDYIPKPFHPLAFLARVKTHLRLLRASRQNARYAKEMEALAMERARQLIHAERLSSLGVLTADIAHELRNPITYISGNVHILKKVAPDIAAAAAYALDHGYEAPPSLPTALESFGEAMESLDEGVRVSLEIIENIRLFSRRTASGEVGATCRLHEPVDQALTISRHRLKYDVEVRKHIPDDLPCIRGEKGRLAQVFVNLLVNAADACKGVENAVVTIAARSSRAGVVCTVSDTGCGMTPETLARLCEPFYTTKGESDGTGLGLSITRQIVKSLGGMVEVESTVGEGTTFTLTFVVPADASAADPAPGAGPSADTDHPESASKAG